eukprot:scaffold19923_cov107-Isochrysis_galbana.AAC.11
MRPPSGPPRPRGPQHRSIIDPSPPCCAMCFASESPKRKTIESRSDAPPRGAPAVHRAGPASAALLQRVVDDRVQQPHHSVDAADDCAQLGHKGGEGLGLLLHHHLYRGDVVVEDGVGYHLGVDVRVRLALPRGERE